MPKVASLFGIKFFEASRNKEMAETFPDLADFLLELNERMYDLGDIVSYGYYVHPDFKGSWSIKNVLPVLVPELNYKDLDVQKGDEAMLVWWKLINGKIDNPKQVKQNLLDYCQLDTLAMVRIWEELRKLV